MAFSFAALNFIKPELKQLDSKNPLHWAAVGFGSGLSPKAPGTMGTVAAIPLWYGLSFLPSWAYIAMLFITFIIGIKICDAATDAIGVQDHGAIVWDEFVGYWLTMLFVPVSWTWMFIGFVLFRIFDILKPWPIRYFDRHVHGGLGIMLDDVIAGLFALACMQGLIYYLPM